MGACKKTQFSVLQTWFVWAFGAKSLFCQSVNRAAFPRCKILLCTAALALHPFYYMYNCNLYSAAINWCTSIDWCNTIQKNVVQWNSAAGGMHPISETGFLLCQMKCSGTIFWHHTCWNKILKGELFKVREALALLYYFVFCSHCTMR